MNEASALYSAEVALERGDYGQCLEYLEPLEQKYPLTTYKGAKIRMLMVTAFMGKGDEGKAISTCRLITRCKDPDLRQRSKQLLSVLEAPSLTRPKDWSIRLPKIDLNPSTGGTSKNTNKKKRKQPSPPLPPTGPTKAFSIGFSSLAGVILIILTILLSGCVRIRTELHLPSPDRIQLDWSIESKTDQLLPWQIQFEHSLKEIIPEINFQTTSDGKQFIKAPLMNSKEANLVLQKTISTATEAAGIEIPSPQISLKEKNWLIGVHQDLMLVVDLRELPKIPGLSLSVLINPSANKDNLNSKPNSIKSKNEWVLKQQQVNQMELHTWKWNHLGIGTLLIIGLMILSMILQSLRLSMGFGFPELPP